jgi:hypothetical protein
MLRHKEERKDEVFVGNTSTIITEKQEHLFRLNNINYRYGNIAYDIHGKIIKGNGIKPLFIKNDSCKKYDKLMRKLSGFTTDVEGILLS